VNNPIRRIKPDKTGVNAPLGDLEQAVMKRVWGSGEAGVLAGDVQQEIDKEHPIAITTVLTTLDRLRDKGIVQREREGKAYRYWTAVSEEELQQRIVGGVLDRLIAQFPKAVAAYFAQQPSGVKAPDKVELADLARRMEEMESTEPEDEHGH
jgi:predicted transcriptional regulator